MFINLCHPYKYLPVCNQHTGIRCVKNLRHSICDMGSERVIHQIWWEMAALKLWLAIIIIVKTALKLGTGWLCFFFSPLRICWDLEIGLFRYAYQNVLSMLRCDCAFIIKLCLQTFFIHLVSSHLCRSHFYFATFRFFFSSLAI